VKIKAIIENDNGTRELQATLTDEQHRYLLEYALADIMSKGVMVPVVHDEVVTLVEIDSADVGQPAAN